MDTFAARGQWKHGVISGPAGKGPRHMPARSGNNARRQLISRLSSDAHGHDDVAVAAGFVTQRTELACGLFVLQLETDRTVGRGGEKIKQGLGVEDGVDG